LSFRATFCYTNPRYRLIRIIPPVNPDSRLSTVLIILWYCGFKWIWEVHQIRCNHSNWAFNQCASDVEPRAITATPSATTSVRPVTLAFSVRTEPEDHTAQRAHGASCGISFHDGGQSLSGACWPVTLCNFTDVSDECAAYIFYNFDTDIPFLWNVCKFLPDWTATQPLNTTLHAQSPWRKLIGQCRLGKCEHFLFTESYMKSMNMLCGVTAFLPNNKMAGTFSNNMWTV
jgi:hypothetical protein